MAQCRFMSVGDLAQNLRFAEDHGVKPARHPAKMLDSLGAGMAIQAGFKFGGGQAACLYEEIYQRRKRIGVL